MSGGRPRRLAAARAARAGPRWSATCRSAIPSVDASIEAMRAMVEGGVDIIEVGVPYSDPVMDGRRSRPPASRRCAPASAPDPTRCARCRRSPTPAPPRW